MKNHHWHAILLFTAAAGAAAGCALAGGYDNGATESGAGGEGGVGVGGGTNSGTTGAGGSVPLAEDTNNQENTDGGGGGALPADGGAGGSGAGGGGGGGLATLCADGGTPRTFYMSADDSSSMGSPTVAREYLRAGQPPPPALIRTYEFLNYYHVRYPLPADDKLGVHVHFANSTSGSYRLQVGVQAFEGPRPPMSLTFVVDTSGSLLGEGILRERAAIRAISGQLVQGDIVNFVTWSNEDADLLEGYPVAGPDDPTLAAVADALAPGGGSDLHAGLVQGYSLAKSTYGDKRLNRVVLISDGGANLGVVDRDLIAAEAEKGDKVGIHLVGIGVGPALGYSDVLMNAVTDAGRGSYVYLDSVEEADAILGQRFREVMDLAARNVEIAVTIPSYFDIQTSSGEGYSQDKSAIKPQHIAPADSMVLNQVLTLFPETALCDLDPIKVKVSWFDPFLYTSSGQNFTTWEQSIASVTGEPWQLLKAEAIFAYARALQSQKKSDFDVAKAALEKAKKQPELEQDAAPGGELHEIEDLIGLFPVKEMK